MHRRHYQFSAENWRLNFLSGLTAVLPRERLTVLTVMWPHIIVTCPCSPRTLCHVKLIRYHHHHHHHSICITWMPFWDHQRSALGLSVQKITSRASSCVERELVWWPRVTIELRKEYSRVLNWTAKKPGNCQDICWVHMSWELSRDTLRITTCELVVSHLEWVNLNWFWTWYKGTDASSILTCLNLKWFSKF